MRHHLHIPPDAVARQKMLLELMRDRKHLVQADHDAYSDVAEDSGQKVCVGDEQGSLDGSRRNGAKLH